jgi:hypothetical protein
MIVPGLGGSGKRPFKHYFRCMTHEKSRFFNLRDPFFRLFTRGHCWSKITHAKKFPGLFAFFNDGRFPLIPA